MQPIPAPVHNVTIYAYTGPTEPLSEVILSGASGTYSVGTLITSIFYNLKLDNEGKQENPLNLHGQYYATGQYETGQFFASPWMYCLNNSSQPEFGRTITLGASSAATSGEDIALGVSMDVGVESGLIALIKLHNITVSQHVPSAGTSRRVLIENGDGYLLTTRNGTPQVMGVKLDSGELVGPVRVGERNILFSGSAEDGRRISHGPCTCVSPPFPAVFLAEPF